MSIIPGDRRPPDPIVDIFSFFDTRTTALFTAITFFLEASAIGVQVIIIREYKGVGIALLGNLGFAAGFLLTIFRGFLSDFLTLVLANALILAGVSLIYIAISTFTGQGYNRLFVLALTGSTLFLIIFFRYVHDDLGMRIAVFSIAVAVGVSASCYKIWRARHASYSFSGGLTLVSLSIYALLMLLRAAAALRSPPASLFEEAALQNTGYLLVYILSFFWTTGFILMISQRLHADLAELATVDFLTRIPNRRATEGFLEKELSRTTRGQGQFSILLIDVDQFKNINDRYGHAAGDRALYHTAEVFKANIRKLDSVGRWGGDEFLIILSGATIHDAVHLADRLNNKFSESNIMIDNRVISITISIGIASSSHFTTVDEILKIADKALYKAKKIRNTYILAAETPLE